MDISLSLSTRLTVRLLVRTVREMGDLELLQYYYTTSRLDTCNEARHDDATSNPKA
jgi:hypothetical protein